MELYCVSILPTPLLFELSGKKNKKSWNPMENCSEEVSNINNISILFLDMGCLPFRTIPWMASEVVEISSSTLSRPSLPVSFMRNLGKSKDKKWGKPSHSSKTCSRPWDPFAA